MKTDNTKRISKFLSLVLRHKPHLIGIKLDFQGYTDVDKLILKMKEFGKSIDLQTLKYVVKTNNKKRFCFSENKTKIRANQGHSVEVELGYKSKTPPKVLFHGTSERSLSNILKIGLRKQNRHHVHLSKDITTAKSVGSRHGKAVVLEIASEKMHKQGYEFFQSTNGVWLVKKVPAEFLRVVYNT